VKAPLDAVRLTFTEAVSAPAYVVVTGPAGRADAGAAQVRGAGVSVGLRSDLAAGRYTVVYRVVSDDGHPLEDTFTFQLSAAAPAAVSAGPSSSPSPLASAAPAAAAAAALPASSDHSGHWLMGFAGVAMVVAGAGALLYERHQRGAEDDPPIDPPADPPADPPVDPPFDTDESGGAGADGAPAGTTQDGIRNSQGGPS
jgi:hypothetical protein